MSKRKRPCLELTQNASIPPSPEPAKSSSSSSDEWLMFSSSSSSTSSVSYSSKMLNEEGTCVISMDDEEKVQRGNDPKTKAMDLVGCPRCFMYVMLSEDHPKCPKCKTTVFLEFFKDENFKTDN